MQDDHDRPQDDHDADAGESSDDINETHDAEDEQSPAGELDDAEDDPTKALAQAIGNGDPDVAFAGLAEANHAAPSKTVKPISKAFGFGPRCTAILKIGYVLAWLSFGLAALGELLVLWLLVIGVLSKGDARDALWILAAGPIALLNSFIWIVVLARVLNLEKPVLVARPVSRQSTREGRDLDGINVEDFPDVRHNDPADVAAELGDRDGREAHG